MKDIPLDHGDHVMLRLSSAEEQLCEVYSLSHHDHTVALRVVDAAGCPHGKARWFAAELIAAGHIRKVDAR